MRFKVRRALDGQPLGGSAFTANVVKPDEVPGAYEAWMKDHVKLHGCVDAAARRILGSTEPLKAELPLPDI